MDLFTETNDVIQELSTIDPSVLKQVHAKASAHCNANKLLTPLANLSYKQQQDKKLSTIHVALIAAYYHGVNDAL